MRLGHERFQFGKTAAARKQPGQQGKIRRTVFQLLGKHPFGGAFFQFFRLFLFRYAEICVYARAVKISAHDARTEGMQGADIRRADLGKLRFQKRTPCAVRFGVDGGCHRLFQPLFHLLCREIGKGHRQKGRDFRLSRKDEGDDLFDHDKRLAAPRRGGYENFSARFDRGALLRRGPSFAHSPRLLFTMSAISAISTCFSSRKLFPSNPHMPP